MTFMMKHKAQSMHQCISDSRSAMMHCGVFDELIARISAVVHGVCFQFTLRIC